MALIAIVCMLLLCKVVDGYNLDTEFRVIYSGQFGDYFGYTVALHKNSDGSRVLIGAPRANSSVLPLHSIHQPGVLFICSIPTRNEDPTCSKFVIDPEGNTPARQGDGYSYHDKKDNMWLGVSLDVQRSTYGSNIVTCGHLWKNQLYQNHLLANGICYVISDHFEEVNKLVPLVQKSKQAIKFRNYPSSIYYFAYGQAGISVAYSEDGKQLIIGAPGIFDWKGSIIKYSSDPGDRKTLYTRPIIPPPPADIAENSYLGYSITTGRFFNTSDTFYASGAPRDNESHGRVYVFKMLEDKNNELFIHQKMGGTQFGEYFGASVLGVNLNGDRYTDLLVGAPFHSLENGGDEGKVYMYVSNGLVLQLYVELMGDSKPNSRFGTAIANVDDLNQDGFNDVAVGAPYEDGKGAVYIYHGSEDGMKVQYVQKIEAVDIDSSLSGFGIHISHGLDIDGNLYPDILVGAYASSKAVLFRTRPVIKLFPRLIFTPNQININLTNCEFAGKMQPCVKVTACLTYSEKYQYVEIPLNFVYETYVEIPDETSIISPRGFFVRNERQMTMIKDNVLLENDVEKCTTNVLYLHPNIKDIITPVQILFKYNLVEPENVEHLFHRWFPVIDPSIPTNITSSISFQTLCDNEYKCLSDLVVTATLLGNEGSSRLIRGEVSSISLSVIVKNKGEPAYLSELLIYLPPEMPSINQDFCDSSKGNSNVSLICDLGNPLLKKLEVKILIKLDVTKIPSDRKYLDILLEARTASTETAPENNFITIPLFLQAVADIGVMGVSSQEVIFYDEDELSKLSVPMTHTYIIRNHGPSPVQLIDILLKVPEAFVGPEGKMQFLTLTDSEGDNGKQLTISANCNDTYVDMKNIASEKLKYQEQAFGEDYLTETLEEKDYKRRSNSSKDIEPSTDLRVDSDEEKQNNITKKNIEETVKPRTSNMRELTVISCETENVQCKVIHCTATPFTDMREIAHIKISAKVDLTAINNYLGPSYRVELVTSGSVSTRDTDVQLQNHIPDVAWVKTAFVHKGSPPGEQAPLWIIIVSILVGIVFLLLLLVLLTKCGFFTREKKEQLEEMENDDSVKVEQSETDPLKP